MARPTSDTPFTLIGPLRAPAQMLADQSYGGHASVHDDATAAALGLAAGPIEGPTHFSQLDPLLAALWGDRWFSHGCVSAHFQTMVVGGEEVRATISADGPAAGIVRIDAAKADGTPVLAGTASLGPDHPETELAPRLARAQGSPPERLHVIDLLSVGQTGPGDETIAVTFEDDFGELYPFSLAEKLDLITEPLDWYLPGADTPWGAPIVPIEMLSVLTNAASKHSGFAARQPSVGLFIDLEVRLLGSPVLVGHTYRIDRGIVALSESRRTESYWTRSTLTDVATDVATAEVLLHQGVFKDSYPGYPTGSD
ncbi:MAG: hypothetical protein MK177_05915 [Acidimicrobiales bacterium]|nr:hypothetical protein [Acidimicrobiales bacterium]